MTTNDTKIYAIENFIRDSILMLIAVFLIFVLSERPSFGILLFVFIMFSPFFYLLIRISGQRLAISQDGIIFYNIFVKNKIVKISWSEPIEIESTNFFMSSDMGIMPGFSMIMKQHDKKINLNQFTRQLSEKSPLGQHIKQVAPDMYQKIQNSLPKLYRKS